MLHWYPIANSDNRFQGQRDQCVKDPIELTYKFSFLYRLDAKKLIIRIELIVLLVVHVFLLLLTFSN